jgi:thioredoxin-related protein
MLDERNQELIKENKMLKLSLSQRAVAIFMEMQDYVDEKEETKTVKKTKKASGKLFSIPTCPECGRQMTKNGTRKDGTQRYRC